MTNTKFRKKALLSSVAMLLVALVALGSATFAWFLANPNVETQGLKMQTAASAGLSVATASYKAAYATAHSSETGYNIKNAFRNDSILNATNNATTTSTIEAKANAFVLTPASFNFEQETWSDISWYTAAAGGADASSKGTGNYTTSGISASTYSDASFGGVYYENIYLRTSVNAQTDEKVVVKQATVTIDSSSDELAGAIRVALVGHQGTVGTSGQSGYVAAADYLIGVWKATNATSATNTTAVADFTYVTGASATAKTYAMTATGTAKAFPSGHNMTVNNSDSANYVTAYVWLDGEDYNVFSSQVNNLEDLLGSNGIKIAFSTNELG